MRAVFPGQAPGWGGGGTVSHVGLESLAPQGEFPYLCIPLPLVDHLALKVSPDEILTLALSTRLHVAFSLYL